MYKKYICLIASRDVKLLILKYINLREKGESSINFLLYIIHIVIIERSSLYFLYIKISIDKA